MKKVLFSIFILTYFLGVTSLSYADYQGTIGTRFIISGSGFGTSKSKVYLLNGNKQVLAKVESWSDTSITCLWTKKLNSGTYNLFVQPKTKGSQPVQIGTFSIVSPYIYDITPDTGVAGDVITITGKFFSSKKPQIYLEEPATLKRTKCKVLNSLMDPISGESSLQFSVPKGYMGTKDIIVKNNIGEGHWGSISKRLKEIDSGVDYYNNLIAGGNTNEEALVNTIDWYKTQPGVLDAFMAADGQNIFVEDNTGIITLIVTSSPSQNLTYSKYSLPTISNFKEKLASSITGIKAMIMDPYKLDINNATAVRNILNSKAGISVEYMTGGQVWPGLFDYMTENNLSDVDLIYYSGHGAVNKQTGTVSIGTGEIFSEDRRAYYEKILKDRGYEPVDKYIYRFKTSSEPATFGITSYFIEGVSKGLKATTVYIDSCHSIEIDTMAKAFINNGAKSYLGWNKGVFAILTDRLAESFFKDIVNCNSIKTAYNNLLPYALSCDCIGLFCSVCLPLPGNIAYTTVAKLVLYPEQSNAKLLGCESPITDTIPPSVPTGVIATAVSSSQVDLSWDTSTDNVGVAGYKIYRNGSYLKSVSSSPTFASDTNLSPSTQYCYTVSAYDASGNESGLSSQICATTESADITTKQWAKTYGGNEGDYMKSMQQTSDGGYIVVGETFSFGQKKGDMWILKLNSDGDIVWQKTYYAGTQNVNATAIQQTSDNGFIVSGCIEVVNRREDAWLLKLDSNGNIQWQKTHGGNYSDYINSIQQISDGYIAVGDTDSFGAGNHDAWVLKLDSSGNIQWQKTYGSDGWDTAYSVDKTSDDGYILAGQTHSFGGGYPNTFNMWIIRLDSNGNVQWQNIYGSNWNSVNTIQRAADNGFIVSGTKAAGIGQYDMVLIKLDSNGSIQWQKAYGGEYYEDSAYVQQTSDGGYILAGLSSSFSSPYLSYLMIKLDLTGNIEWEKTYKTPYELIGDAMPMIFQTPDSGYILAGHTNSYGAGWIDLWLLKLDTTGNIGTSCSLIESTNAIVIYTSITPMITSGIINISGAETANTNVIPQNSNAIVATQCSH